MGLTLDCSSRRSTALPDYSTTHHQDFAEGSLPSVPSNSIFLLPHGCKATLGCRTWTTQLPLRRLAPSFPLSTLPAPHTPARLDRNLPPVWVCPSSNRCSRCVKASPMLAHLYSHLPVEAEWMALYSMWQLFPTCYIPSVFAAWQERTIVNNTVLYIWKLLREKILKFLITRKKKLLCVVMMLARLTVVIIL